jgi:hypothetical protein
MTSLQVATKQVPLNNGYYRVVPALLPFNVGGNAPVGASSFMYTLTNGALGAYTPQSAGALLALSTGCLLKDMGAQFISSSTVGTSQPQVFRRVQILNNVVGAATNGVGGSSTGSDSDYDCAYIAMGFSGALPSVGLGPFIRTG